MDITIIILTENINHLIHNIEKQSFTGKIEILKLNNENNINTLVKSAQGKYILFLEDNNELNPRTLEIIYKRAEKTSADLTYINYIFKHNNKFIYTNKDSFLKYNSLEKEQTKELLCAEKKYINNFLYRKDFLIRFNYKSEDHDSFYRKIIEKANKITIINNPYFYILKKVKEKDYRTFTRKTKDIIKKIINYKYTKLPLQEDIILFLGFDYRYTGNSRYFFEYLIKQNKHKIYFATNNLKVPDKYRVPPHTTRFKEIYNQSKIIILESWDRKGLIKKEGSIWIQLWHGTPFKKLVFDSPEYYTMDKKPHTKIRFYNDLKRWDYLLADSNWAKQKFQSAFFIPEDKILNLGYPRVHWLKENIHNHELKEEIYKKLNISSSKNLVLYAPTWRDYNYNKKEQNLNYQLDLQKLSQELGENYIIINKQHNFQKPEQQPSTTTNNIIEPSENIDMQELILIADLIITDYSSTLFDAYPINKPIFYYITDAKEYQQTRGIYEDLYQSIQPFHITKENITETLKKYHSYNNFTPEMKKQYEKIKQKYCNNKNENPNPKIEEKCQI